MGACTKSTVLRIYRERTAALPKRKRSGGMEQNKPYTPANGEKNGAGEVEW